MAPSLHSTDEYGVYVPVWAVWEVPSVNILDHRTAILAREKQLATQPHHSGFSAFSFRRRIRGSHVTRPQPSIFLVRVEPCSNCTAVLAWEKQIAKRISQPSFTGGFD